MSSLMKPWWSTGRDAPVKKGGIRTRLRSGGDSVRRAGEPVPVPFKRELQGDRDIKPSERAVVTCCMSLTRFEELTTH